MAFAALNHVAVTVSDMTVSGPWYRNLIGEDPVLDEHTDAGYRHLVWALPGGTLFGIHEHDRAIAAGEPKSAIFQNCSGKHAAMLLTCRTNGWDTATYLDPAHPLQVHIREVIERLIGGRVTATAVDGCGAPVYGMGLSSLARAAHRIGTSSERSPFALHRTAGALVRAVRENPWAIDGPGRAERREERAPRRGPGSEGGGVRIGNTW